MKLRTDFVTNSSSSSFIFGKKDENITVDTVFDIIKSLYLEYAENFERLISVCDSYGLKFNEDDGSFSLIDEDKYDDTVDGKQAYWKRIDIVSEQLKRDYGLSYWSCYFKPDWLFCKTYAEYEDYWISKMQENSDYQNHAPFSIVDYRVQKEYYPIHYRIKNGNPEKIPDPWNDDVFTWYIGCADRIENNKANKIDKEYCDYCYMSKEMCSQFKKGCKNHKITRENAFITMLGSVVILSECGYIPDNIVESLQSIVEFSCNHMG